MHASSSQPNSPTRRRFLRTLTQAAGILAANSVTPFAFPQGTPDKTPEGSKKLGVALLGLGGYSTGQLGPALQETKFCRLAGIVTGTPSKAQTWSRKYDLAAKCVYNYENFDRIADNSEIDVVYVVTPNALHTDYVVRAARAGKHVICEKPMATSVADCDRMITACREAKRKLSIGYRLHFDPYNLEAARLGREKVYGAVRHIETANGFTARPGSWRFDPKLSGGGPLMDMGIYSLQAALYVTGEEPISISAREEKTEPEIYKNIEETLRWTFEFPSGAKADCTTSYHQNLNRLRVEAERGEFELGPAFSYRGIAGHTPDGTLHFPAVNQQARQMDAFARCILDDTLTIVPGEMGRRDVRLLLGIYEAARTGKKVEVTPTGVT